MSDPCVNVVWVIEQRLPANGRWYPWCAYVGGRHEARDGLRYAKEDNAREDWKHFRIRKYSALPTPAGATMSERVTFDRLVQLAGQMVDHSEVWELGPLDRPDLRSLLCELIAYRNAEKRRAQPQPAEPARP